MLKQNVGQKEYFGFKKIWAKTNLSSKKILNSTKCSFFQLILQINIDMTYSTNYIKNWIIFKREFQTYRIIKSLVRKAVDDKCPDGISPDIRILNLFLQEMFYFRYCQAQLQLQLRAEIELSSLLSVHPFVVHQEKYTKDPL